MITSNSELGITWLGQGGFLIESGGVKIAVDPYLSDSLQKSGYKRSFPPPVSAEKIRPDLVCVTHDRPGHFDEETLLALYKYCHECVITGPEAVIAHCRRLGFNPARMVTLVPGENTFSYENMRIRGVRANHPDGGAIGVAINAGPFRIYITGDTRRDDSLPEAVKNALGGTPDVMAVCINGRDGCMDDVDAFRLVRALQPKVAIPTNFGLFQKDTADPRPFVEYVSRVGIHALMPEPGKAFVIRAEQSRQEELQTAMAEA